MNEAPKSELSPIGTGTVAKTFQILDLFQKDKPAWTQAELSRATGMQRPVISRIARFLDGRGLLTRDPVSGKYRLGPAAIDLGRRAEASFDLSAICQPLLVKLAEETQETVILTKYDESRQVAVCIHQIESQLEGLRVFERIGTSFPLHAGAAPKAILTLLREAEQKAYMRGSLKHHQQGSMIDRQALREDLKHSRAQGYAISSEETYPGVVGVAAGFVGHGGDPVGSIAIAGPIFRFSESRVHEAGQHLRHAANEITYRIGGAPDR